MIRSLFFPDGGLPGIDLAPSEFKTSLQNPEGMLWVDFEGTPPAMDEPILREQFSFHPLAIDDALQESHVPKLDDWGSYLYIVLHAVFFTANGEPELETRELDVFLGRNYMVTHHDQPIPSLDRVWNAVQRDERYHRHGPDHLLYRLIDDIVASYMPVVEALDDEIDLVEDHVFSNPTPRTLERIMALKRATLKLRRIIAPQREVINRLARDTNEVIDAHDRVYFRDVYDHMVRLYDITESIRDLVSGVLDTYLSVINNRMNDIMKTLTVITTLFMPLTFLTGFFGMNFFEPVAGLNGWTGWPMFVFILVITFLIPVGMFVWVRRRGWM